MQPRSLRIYLALLLFAAASARPQYEYDDYNYDDYDYDNKEEEVFEELPQPEFTMESQHLVAREGESIIIPCPSINSEPYVMVISRTTPANYLLFVGSVAVRRSRKHKLVGDFLEISHLEPNDSGDYLCTIQSPDAPIELSHTLEVQFAPVFRNNSRQQKEMLLLKGDSVTLECDAYGNPEPLITWSKLNGHLPTGSEEEEGNTFTLLDVDRHMEGSYTCTANNGIGDVVSQTFTLSIQFMPEIIAEEESITTNEGHQVELACLVYAYPLPVVFWTKDDHFLTSEAVKEEGNRLSLRIPHMTQTDFGTYVCHAKNLMGESSVAIQVTERSQQIEEERRQPIENERSQPNEGIMAKGSHSTEEERYHQSTKERDPKIMVEKTRKVKPAKGTDLEKWIIITTNLARLLGRMWGKL